MAIGWLDARLISSMVTPTPQPKYLCWWLEPVSLNGVPSPTMEMIIYIAEFGSLRDALMLEDDELESPTRRTHPPPPKGPVGYRPFKPGR